MVAALLLLCAAGFLLLWRTARCPDDPRAQGVGGVSVIIPARNEAHNLPSLLASLASQDPLPLEVIVVDDASTDDTAAIAREYAARVVQPPALPDGWRGKTWACHHGAEAAKGDRLLFLDADTRLQSNALGRMLAACHAPCRALSLGPYHEVEKPYEQLSAVFNLLTFMGMGAFGVLGSPDRPHGLFGPVLLIDRAAYNAVGGHAAVRSEILEHMSMRRLLADRAIPVRCLNGRGVVHTRMYPDGLRSLVEGWTKAFAAGASKTGGTTLIVSVLWMTGGMLAAILALLPALRPMAPAWNDLVPYGAYTLSLYVMLRRIGRFRWWASPCYPLLFVTFFLIFGRSAMLRSKGGSVTWKGRSMSATAEDHHS